MSKEKDHHEHKRERSAEGKPEDAAARKQADKQAANAQKNDEVQEENREKLRDVREGALDEYENRKTAPALDPEVNTDHSQTSEARHQQRTMGRDPATQAPYDPSMGANPTPEVPRPNQVGGDAHWDNPPLRVPEPGEAPDNYANPSTSPQPAKQADPMKKPGSKDKK